MNKELTNRTLGKHSPEEVNEFLDGIIKQVESLMADNKLKTAELAKKDKEIMTRDEKIHRLAMEAAELKRQLKRYEDIEETLSRTMQITRNAEEERDKVIADAKRNADRIVNEALLSAEKTEMEANMLRRNIKMLKNKMRAMIDSQIKD